MANTIKIKRGSGSDPAASDMVLGEPVLRTDTAELFFKKDDGSVAKVSGGGGGPDFKYLALRNAANNGAASFPNADFTLVTSGTTTAITPAAANTLLVSVNGVIQKPNTGTSTPSQGFALSGSTIKFGANISTAPDFILYQESGGIGEPSDETVSEAKLKVSNSPVNGYFLSAQSGNTGGLTWAAPVATSCTGNSATATALATARTINGTSFDGTSNITVTAAAGTLTGNTLNSSVTASSLTSLGDLSGLTVTGNMVVDTNTLFVNASTNRVGIGTTTPTAALSIKGADTSTGSGGTAALELRQGDANNEFVNLGFQTGSGGPLAVISAIADATGVYPNTTGQLTFNTQVGSGVFERMRIDSSGRLLLAATSASGADSTADDLVIGNTSQGNNGMTIVTAATNNGGFFFADQDSTVRGGIRYQHGNDRSQFYAGGDVVLNLQNKGVGINETSFAADALTIRGGDIDDTPSLILKRATDGTQSSGEIIGKLQFTTNENNVDSGNYQPRVEIQGEITDTVGGAAMVLYTAAGSATSPTESMRIDSSGVDITGAITGTGDLTLDTGGSTGINLKRSGTLKADIEIGSSSDELAIRARGSSGFINFATGSSGTERMRIDSNGASITGNLHVDDLPNTTTNSYLKIAIQDTDGTLKSDDTIKINPAQDALSVNGMFINSNTVRASANGPVTITTANASGTVDLLVKTTHVECNGNFLPQTNDTDNLGSSSLRWANIYTNDLNLSNEGSSNDVDSTWGSYTIQEGAEDLFLINRRNGKKYKFNLTEVL